MARTLRTPLGNAGIPPPYVLVGRSLGGLVVRMFTHLYSGEVAALALVDSSHPGEQENQFSLAHQSVMSLATLTADDFAGVIGTASILRGDAAYGTWTSMPAHPRPGQFDPRLYTTPGPVSTTQPLIVSIAGVEHNLGSAYSYLPSARAEGDPNAEPGPDGTIPVTLVPGDNNDAIRSIRKLSTDEVTALVAHHRSARVPGPTTAEPGTAGG